MFDGDEGRLTEEAFLRDFAGDVPPENSSRALYAVQWPFNKAVLLGRTAHAAWRSKPATTLFQPRIARINPDLERFMAKRMGAETIEIQ